MRFSTCLDASTIPWKKGATHEILSMYAECVTKKYRTRVLVGECACISTGRKCVLNSESVPNNKLCIID